MTITNEDGRDRDQRGSRAATCFRLKTYATWPVRRSRSGMCLAPNGDRRRHPNDASPKNSALSPRAHATTPRHAHTARPALSHSPAILRAPLTGCPSRV